MNAIRSVLEGGAGFAIGLGLRPDELARVRALIREQWLHRIAECAPNAVDKFASIEMDQYHEFAHLLDHGSVWPKSRRILGPAAVEEIRGMSLVHRLEEEFGRFEISDEDEVGHEEMYWRLVRPSNPADVGPLHADEWFWALGHGFTPPDKVRVKVWMAIYCERGENGFRFVSGSHKTQWRYHGEFRHGIMKPCFDEDESAFDINIFESHPGQAIVFHDRLLHGGSVGGARTRVSLEFTMFVDRGRYFS